MKKFWKNYKFPIILLCSIIIGCILGIVLKEDAVVLKPLGSIFLNLMYTIVVPLVFFTISSSIANMVNLKRLGKILKYVFLVFIMTSAVAGILMLGVVKVIDPVGDANIVLEQGEATEISIGEQIVSALTVTDFSNLLSRSNMLPLIIFTILFGIGVALTKNDKLAKCLENISNVMMKIINIIMYYAPIGLCAYFANLIGEF